MNASATPGLGNGSGGGRTQIDPAALSGDRGPSIVAVAVVGLVVSSLATALRFWSRAVASHIPLWWDDWAILATVGSSHVFLALDIFMTTKGMGKHSLAVPAQDVIPQMRATRVSLVFYSTTIWGIKISALLLYGRLFRASDRFVRVLWATGFVATAWFVIMTIYPWTFCQPLSKNWYPMTPGVCREIRPWWYASAFINASLDLVVLLLPMPVIWRLQLNWRKKIAVTGVLLFGYCSAFLSFARFIVIVIRPNILSIVGPDLSWDLVPILYLSMLEGPFAIIALCGPSIHQLALRAVKFGNLVSLFPSRRRETGEKPGSGSGDRQTNSFRNNLRDKAGVGAGASADSSDVKTWSVPDTTAASNSSVTGINTPIPGSNCSHNYERESDGSGDHDDDDDDDDDMPQQHQPSDDIPMANLSPGRGPKPYFSRE